MNVQHKLIRYGKRIWLSVRPRSDEQRICFILGCQRSGTTLLQHIFEEDWNAQVYREVSALSRAPGEHRLQPPEGLRDIFARQRAPLIVLKPLVESQHAAALLEAFPEGRAVWMLRHYRSVASSNLRKFGMRNGIDDLRPIVSEERGNWRAENFPEAVRAFIRERFSEDMPPYEAAVLFWYSRNALFFAQGLENHPRVRLCRYRDLVVAPEACTRSLYAWLGRPWPGRYPLRQIRKDARLTPPDFPLAPTVEEAAQTLWERLLKVYAATGGIP